ncbi:MAG TPA: hypothetical protein VFH51_11985, partial [Myxococcota bacterium]|nr:hypothetical protein [Myxococcota bacterium]
VRRDISVAQITKATAEELRKRGFKVTEHLGGSAVPYVADAIWSRRSPKDADPILTVHTEGPQDLDGMDEILDACLTAALQRLYGAPVSHVSDTQDAGGGPLRRLRVGLSHGLQTRFGLNPTDTDPEHLDLRVTFTHQPAKPYDFTRNGFRVPYSALQGSKKLPLDTYPGLPLALARQHRDAGVLVLDHALTGECAQRLWKEMADGGAPAPSAFMDALLPTTLQAVLHPTLRPGEEDTLGPALRLQHFVTKAREGAATDRVSLALLANAVRHVEGAPADLEGRDRLLDTLRKTLEARKGKHLDPATAALLRVHAGSETSDVFGFWQRVCATPAPPRFDATRRPPYAETTQVLAEGAPWLRTYVPGLDAYIMAPDAPGLAAEALGSLDNLAGLIAKPRGKRETLVAALDLDKHLRGAWEALLPEGFWDDAAARRRLGDNLLALYREADPAHVGYRARLLLAAATLQPDKSFHPELLSLAMALPPGNEREALVRLAQSHRADAFGRVLAALGRPATATPTTWQRCADLLGEVTDAAERGRMAQAVWQAMARDALHLDARTYEALDNILQALREAPATPLAGKV